MGVYLEYSMEIHLVVLLFLCGSPNSILIQVTNHGQDMTALVPATPENMTKISKAASPTTLFSTQLLDPVLTGQCT